MAGNFISPEDGYFEIEEKIELSADSSPCAELQDFLNKKISVVVGYSMFYPITRKAFEATATGAHNHFDLHLSDILTLAEEAREHGLHYYIEAIVKLPWVRAEDGMLLINALRNSIERKKDPKRLITICNKRNRLRSRPAGRSTPSVR